VDMVEWKRDFGMHAFRRLIQARMDERGYKPADVVRLSGLSRQTLHSILTDSRDTIKEMPSRKTVQVLAEALRMPADQLLIAAAEAYGVPVAAPYWSRRSPRCPTPNLPMSCCAERSLGKRSPA
jgi:transcriptional regulator with XRE-family HTH domain